MKTGNQNEHGVDVVQFMSLAAPHRWSVVRSYLQDSNATFDEGPFTSVSAEWDHSPAFRNPDTALMEREPDSVVDRFCDTEEIYGTRRQEAHWLYERLGAIRTLSKLRREKQEKDNDRLQDKLRKRRQSRPLKPHRPIQCFQSPTALTKTVKLPSIYTTSNGLLGNWESSGFSKAEYNRLHDHIYAAIVAGKTNEQISNDMGSEYGDFVLNALRRKFEWLEQQFPHVANNIRKRLGIAIIGD